MLNTVDYASLEKRLRDAMQKQKAPTMNSEYVTPDPSWEKQKQLWAMLGAIRKRIEKHASGRFKIELFAEHANTASISPSEIVALAHALALCDDLERFIHDKRFDEAKYCIGFVRAVMWIHGLAAEDEILTPLREEKP